jgi:predicted hotdog family 3-hydroxylacyl-ACP dehydratase
MMTSPENLAVTDLIPHRPPMLLIDRLLQADSQRALASKTFRENDYGLDGQVVSEAALIECIAQTVAAMHGYENVNSGDSPGLGYLVGLAGFSIFAQPRQGQELIIEVQTIKRLGAMCLVEGSIRCSDQVQAEGQLKFFIPEGDHEQTKT